MGTVIIEKQTNYNKEEISKKIKTILQSLNLPKEFEKKKILIKPNCTGEYLPSKHKTTHPSILEALIIILKSIDCEILIGESSSVKVDTNSAFLKTGIKKVAEKYKIKLVDFKKSKYKKIKIKKGLILKDIFLPEEIVEADYIISLAKLKTNFVSTISCSAKNMKGVLRDEDKMNFHRIGLNKAVHDLASYFKNTVAVVDGIIGNELGRPKKANVIVASRSLFECDYVCAEIMGVNPNKAGHIRSWQIKEKIKVKGELIKNNFNTSISGLDELSKIYNIEIIDGNPCCNCIGALHHILKKVEKENPALFCGLVLAVGPNVFPQKNVIMVGNCAPDSGVRGCPPTSGMFIDYLKLNKKNEKNSNRK